MVGVGGLLELRSVIVASSPPLSFSLLMSQLLFYIDFLFSCFSTFVLVSRYVLIAEGLNVWFDNLVIIMRVGLKLIILITIEMKISDSKGRISKH